MLMYTATFVITQVIGASNSDGEWKVDDDNRA